jgi:hypothetical protein
MSEKQDKTKSNDQDRELERHQTTGCAPTNKLPTLQDRNMKRCTESEREKEKEKERRKKIPELVADADQMASTPSNPPNDANPMELGIKEVELKVTVGAATNGVLVTVDDGRAAGGCEVGGATARCVGTARADRSSSNLRAAAASL